MASFLSLTSSSIVSLYSSSISLAISSTSSRTAKALKCQGFAEERLFIVVLHPQGVLSSVQSLIPLVQLESCIGLVPQALSVERFQLLVLPLQVRLCPEVLHHLVTLAIPCKRALPILVGKGLISFRLDLLAKIENSLYLASTQDLLSVGRFPIDAAHDAVGLNHKLV